MTKNQWIGVFISLAVVIFFVFGGQILFMFNNARQSAPVSGSENTMNQNQPIINTEGLEVSDITVGTGAEAKNGDLLAVNYTGWLEDGEQFDSSSGKGQFQFVIGAGQVIPGWEIGVLGMKEGGKRRIVIPPALAYGENGVDPVIPPNATITFEVELVKVSKAPQQ